MTKVPIRRNSKCKGPEVGRFLGRVMARRLVWLHRWEEQEGKGRRSEGLARSNRDSAMFGFYTETES